MGYNWLISCNKYSVEKHTIKSWKFNSTLQIPAKKTNKKALVVGLTIGSIVLVGGLELLGFVLWKKRIAQEEDEEFTIDMSMDNKFETGSGPKKFLYGEFFRATNNFAEDQKLGEGGFGGVYRGKLTDFNTYFSFVIDSKGRNAFADGLTFFLVSNGSTPNITTGGAIGLPIGSSPTFSATTPFVAVEFDTFHNG
ncbi:hypothetical protein ACSBR2_021847 [Camellia fascicularis]